MSDLTVLLQYIPDWLDKFVERCGGRLGSIRGIGVYPIYPGVTTYGRVMVDNTLSNQLVMMGENGVPFWIEETRGEMDKNPLVEAWQGPNEFVVDTMEKAAAFNAFHVKLFESMHLLGIQQRGKAYRVMAGATNTGHYRLQRYSNDEPPYALHLKPTVDALNAYDGIWQFHEYEWPDIWQNVDFVDGEAVGGARILRYRYNIAEWVQAGCVPPRQVYIGEGFLDHGVIDGVLGGYARDDGPGEDGYLEMLKWYSNQLAHDDYIVGASIFTVCNWDWQTFNVTESLAMKLADFIREDDYTPAPPPTPTPPVDPHTAAKGLYLSKYQEQVTRAVLQALWDDGYRIIGFRVTGPNDPDSPSYTEVDKAFLKWYPVVKEIGFLTYGFHYLHPALNEQAKDFAEVVEGLEFELGLYGDVEHAGLDADRCARFFQAADRETGQTIHVYGRKSQLDAWRVSTVPGYELWQTNRKRRLWLAAWTYDLDKYPYIPKSWEEEEYYLWQYDNEGLLPATVAPDRVCLDVWRGTLEDLEEEFGKEQPPVTGVEVDPRIASFLTITEDPDAVYRLKSVQWMDEAESAGLHHIFVDVIDPDGNRLPGHQVRIFWVDGHTDLTIEEKPGEPWGANFGMYEVLGAYGAHGGTDPEQSDAVEGMGLGTPEQPSFAIHTSFGVTFVFGEEIEPPPPPDDEVTIVDSNGDPVEGMTWESVQADLNVSLIRATPPEGAQVYRLRRLILIETDVPLLRIYTMSEGGLPIPGPLCFMGWENGSDLPPDCAPHLAEGVWEQPPGKPNKALTYEDFDANRANAQGYVEWIWGEGQEYDPAAGEEGPHWGWTRAGDTIYSDVFSGLGVWDKGKMFWPVFVLEDEPGEGPVDPEDDWLVLLAGIEKNTDRIATALEELVGLMTNSN